MIASENPFATRHLERVKFRAPGVTIEGLLEKFERMGRRAAIVGPKGSGKTTLLLELAAGLRRRGWTVVHLRGGQAPLRDLDVPSGAVVLLDEGDALGALAWSRFRTRVRSAAGLLITTHRTGRLPALIECSTSPELLEEVAAELTDGRMDGWRGRLGEVFKRHGGNVREALLELYDISARRTHED